MTLGLAFREWSILLLALRVALISALFLVG